MPDTSPTPSTICRCGHEAQQHNDYGCEEEKCHCSRFRAGGSPTPPPRSTEATLDVPLLVALLNDASRGIYGGEKDVQLRTLASQLPDLFAARASLSAAEQENERLRAQRDEAEKNAAVLQEWRTAVLSALESKPEFIAAKWAGDKRGWGFVFEFINWLYRERDRKASEVEALASGKVWRNHPRMGWWVASDLEDANTLLGPFDSHTEALHALLSPVIPPAASGATLARAQQHTTNESAP